MHVVPKFVSLGCILRQQKFSYPDYRGKEKKRGERERERKREEHWRKEKEKSDGRRETREMTADIRERETKQNVCVMCACLQQCQAFQYP